MMNVGELFGSLAAAPLNDWIGRKGVFLVGCAAVTIGVALQLAATSQDLITAGRAILGIGVGNFSATSPLYMGVCLFGLSLSSKMYIYHEHIYLPSLKEIAPESLRSPLLMCWQLT